MLLREWSFLLGVSWKYVSTDSGKGLAPKSRQNITLVDADNDLICDALWRD